MAHQHTIEQEFSIRFGQDNHSLLQQVFGSNAQFSEFENEAELARWFEKDYAFHPSFLRHYYYVTMAIGQGSCIFITMEKVPASRVQGNMIIEKYNANLNIIGANANKVQELLSNIQVLCEKVIDNAVHIHENDRNRKIDFLFFTIIDIIHDKCQACCGHLLMLSINQTLEVLLRSWATKISKRLMHDRSGYSEVFKDIIDKKIGSVKVSIKHEEQMISDKERASQTFRYWMGWLTTVVLALAMYGLSYVKDWLLKGKK